MFSSRLPRSLSGWCPTVLAVLLIGSWGLLVMAGVQAGVFQLVERRTRSGLHLRTYRALLDRRTGNRTLGRFRCCGVTVEPNPSVFRTITTASVPGTTPTTESLLGRVIGEPGAGHRRTHRLR